MKEDLKRLFVRLASIPSLAELPRKEKRALVTEAERAGIRVDVLLPLGQRGPETIPRMHPVPARAWGMRTAASFACLTPVVGTSRCSRARSMITMAPFAWAVLWDIHPWVKQLADLLREGVPLRLPSLPPRVFSRGWSVKTREVVRTEWWAKGLSPRDCLLDDFADSLKEDPLPYRRCPACNSLFVVLTQRGRPREYCSTACKNHACEAARKGDPKRRKASKDSMERLRARERVPIPVVTIRGTLPRKSEKR